MSLQSGQGSERDSSLLLHSAQLGWLKGQALNHLQAPSHMQPVPELERLG